MNQGAVIKRSADGFRAAIKALEKQISDPRTTYSGGLPGHLEGPTFKLAVKKLEGAKAYDERKLALMVGEA